mgnify:CR=1 FL=1
MIFLKQFALDASNFFLILVLICAPCSAQTTSLQVVANNSSQHVTSKALGQAVNRIVYSIHGFTPGDPKMSAALALLKNNATETVAFIKQNHTTAELVRFLQEESNSKEVRRSNALGMIIITLGKLENTDANDLLGQWYLELQEQRKETANNNKLEKELVIYQYFILHNLRGRYVKPVADSILSRLAKMNENERKLSLLYLATSAKGQTEVRDQLKQLLASNTALAQDSFMQKTLHALAEK